MNNDGPFLDVWFGESMLYGLVERVGPSDLTQAACAAGCGADHGTRALHVTSSVAFVLRPSSVPHATLGPRPLSEDPFVGCAPTVVDYAAQAAARGARKVRWRGCWWRVCALLVRAERWCVVRRLVFLFSAACVVLPRWLPWPLRSLSSAAGRAREHAGTAIPPLPSVSPSPGVVPGEKFSCTSTQQASYLANVLYTRSTLPANDSLQGARHQPR
ncbi:hypothetical protein ERJ75_001641700 [Trypanosoma vivax]|nr:hypothetical protein ERJ75_001811000 [Trypanosoma vivax]KAH8605190.1 hypothetical protein ERJ75_001641700 [Trypanosoma vivax]